MPEDSDEEKSRNEKLEEVMGGEEALAQMMSAMGGMGGAMSMGGGGDRTALEVRKVGDKVEELKDEVVQVRKALERIADGLES